MSEKEKDESITELTEREARLIQSALYYHDVQGAYGAPNHLFMVVIAKLARPYMRLTDDCRGLITTALVTATHEEEE